MTKFIEEKISFCRDCNKETKHARNNSKSSGFMLLVHLILTLSTMGAWLVIVIIWKLLNAKIGGWKCTECNQGQPIWTKRASFLLAACIFLGVAVILASPYL